MASSQSDYILRMIEQLGAALRRLRQRLARGVPAPEVAREAHDAQAELFGAMWPMLGSVDAATAASLVRDSRQLRLWIDFLELEAEAHRQAGDGPRAEALEARLAVLVGELRARERG